MDRWIDQLNEEDLAFLRRFLLASGTLKDLAAQYSVSYPTIRLRLDRLIDKVELLGETPPADRFEARLGSLYADGRIDEVTFRQLREMYRTEKEKV